MAPFLLDLGGGNYSSTRRITCVPACPRSDRSIGCKGSESPGEIAMTMMTIDQAQAHLPEVISKLQPGEEVALTQADRVVAKLAGHAESSQPPRQPGSPIRVLQIVA